MNNRIKKALEFCLKHCCSQCEYDVGNPTCLSKLMNDALEYIEYLEAEIEQYEDREEAWGMNDY